MQLLARKFEFGYDNAFLVVMKRKDKYNHITYFAVEILFKLIHHNSFVKAIYYVYKFELYNNIHIRNNLYDYFTRPPKI